MRTESWMGMKRRMDMAGDGDGRNGNVKKKTFGILKELIKLSLKILAKDFKLIEKKHESMIKLGILSLYTQVIQSKF